MSRGLQNKTSQKPNSKFQNQIYNEHVQYWDPHFKRLAYKQLARHAPIAPPIAFTPIEELFSGFGFEYKSIPGVDSTDMCEGRLLVDVALGQVTVVYAEDVPLSRQRFTIAHELVHLMQWCDFGFMKSMEMVSDDHTRSRIVERLADSVAGYYLAPPQFVMKLYADGASVEMIADTLHVSKQVVEICISKEL